MKRELKYVGYYFDQRICESANITYVKKMLAPYVNDIGSCKIYTYEFVPITPTKFKMRCVRVQYLYKG